MMVNLPEKRKDPCVWCTVKIQKQEGWISRTYPTLACLLTAALCKSILFFFIIRHKAPIKMSIAIYFLRTHLALLYTPRFSWDDFSENYIGQELCRGNLTRYVCTFYITIKYCRLWKKKQLRNNCERERSGA